MDIFFLALTILMLLVVYFDLTSYLIPNWLNGLVLCLYFGLFFLSPTQLDWQSALIATSVIFAVGFVIFALNWMGGGDVKLLIATAPYIGFSMKLLDYLLMMSLLGGTLSLLLWAVRKIVFQVVSVRADKPLPRILQIGAPVPYGLAIAAAFLYLMWTGSISGISTAQLPLDALK